MLGTSMTVDLACLVLNALWGLVLVLIEIMGKTRIAGAAWNAGNRDTEPELPGWLQRAGRALSNHKDNFPLVLTAVVVVQLAHANNRTSAAAAIVYVVARAVHGLLYIVGVKGVRTIAYLTGVAATLVILGQLVA